MHTLGTKIQKERNQQIQDWLSDLENCNNDSNKYFRSLRLINRLGQFQRQPLLKKKPSEILVEKDEALCEILADYFETVMNEAWSDAKTIKVLMQNSKNRDHSSEVSLEELSKAVKSLKKGKSPGADILRSDTVKSAPASIITALQKIINKFISQKKLPKFAEIGILIAIMKLDKDPTLPENFRPIMLLPLTRNVIAIIILNRINTGPCSLVIQKGDFLDTLPDLHPKPHFEDVSIKHQSDGANRREEPDWHVRSSLRLIWHRTISTHMTKQHGSRWGKEL